MTSLQPGIVSLFEGGLGNRLFQVAAAYVASIKYNCPLYLIKSEHQNHHLKRVNYFDELFKEIGIAIDDKTYKDMFPHGLNYSDNYHHPFWVSTEAYSTDNITIPVVFSQYYQYYPPLKMYEKEIRALFLNGLDRYINDIKNTYENLSNSAFLHVRRGDYLLYPRHPVLPISYYEKCINQLDVDTIYVFSDDISWAKNNDYFKQVRNIVFIENDDELYTLAFMTLCKKGAICANSSFSWWGAFLGAYENRSPVFVPSLWMLECRIDSLFPEEWITI